MTDNLGPSNQASIRVGARVVMASGHPWAGHSGEITDADPTGPLQMVLVTLDNGQRCYADPKECRRA
jgi:hypothetical protein